MQGFRSAGVHSPQMPNLKTKNNNNNLTAVILERVQVLITSVLDHSLSPPESVGFILWQAGSKITIQWKSCTRHNWTQTA